MYDILWEIWRYFEDLKNVQFLAFELNYDGGSSIAPTIVRGMVWLNLFLFLGFRARSLEIWHEL